MKPQKWWHRPRPVGFLNYGQKPGGYTQYVDEYTRHRVFPPESFKPNEEMRKSDAKVSDQTTFRIDYIPHPLSKHEPHPKEVYKPPGTAMEGVSMYRQDYPGHRAGPIQLAKRNEGRSIPSVKFEAHPTYTSDYKRWSLQPRVKFGPDHEYKKPIEKMEGTSTFQQDYIHRYAPPRESARPPDVAIQSDVPLESRTVHNTSYVPHQLEARHQRDKEPYLPPTVPMDSTTTFQLDYTGQRSLPAESMRPPQKAFMSTEPISNSSEFRDSYVSWPVERPHRREPLKYMGPQGNMELQTTHRLDYMSKNGRPATPKKPLIRRTKVMPFDGTTNYSTDFKKWGVVRTLPKPRQETMQGGGKFDGISTNRLHYVKYPGVHPAASFKPDGRAFMSDSALDDKTLYRINYIPQSMEQLERYPTPDWMKYQEGVWQRGGLVSRGSARGMTPPATPTVYVAA